MFGRATDTPKTNTLFRNKTIENDPYCTNHAPKRHKRTRDRRTLPRILFLVDKPEPTPLHMKRSPHYTDTSTVKTLPITPPVSKKTSFGIPSTLSVTSAQVSRLRHLKCGEETKVRLSIEKAKEWRLTQKHLKSSSGDRMKVKKEMKEVMKEMKEVMNCPEPRPLVWRQRSPTWPKHHSVDRRARSPVGLGFLAKYGKRRWWGGGRIPDPSSDPIMRLRIERLD